MAHKLRNTLLGSPSARTVIKDYWRVVQKNLVLIVVTTIVGALAGAAYLWMTPTTFESTTKLQTTTTARMTTYARLSVTDQVLKPALEASGVALSLAEARAAVDAEAAQGSLVLEVTVSSDDETVPQALASAVADELVTVSEKLEEANGNRATPFTIVQSATTAHATQGVSPVIIIAGSIVVGALVGLVIAFLRDLVGTRIKSVTELEAMDIAPVLLDLRDDSRSAGFARNLAYIAAAEGNRFSVIPSGKRQEATVAAICIRLGGLVAENGSSALLIDAAFSTRLVSKQLDLAEAVGTSDVVARIATLEETVQNQPSGFSVLPAGSPVPNPRELSSAQALADLVSETAEDHDYLVCSTEYGIEDPQPVAGTAAIIAVSIDKSTRRQLTSVVEACEEQGIRVAALVVAEN